MGMKVVRIFVSYENLDSIGQRWHCHMRYACCYHSGLHMPIIIIVMIDYFGNNLELGFSFLNIPLILIRMPFECFSTKGDFNFFFTG